MQFNWKKWNIFVLLIFFLSISSVFLLNYFVDPLWCFNHSIIGCYQRGFDERQQKTNWLTFHDVDFDTVIFGDSRVTYMDPQKMPNPAFNYSSSSMKPVEFPEYLRYASARSKSPISVVVIGMSFHQTNGSTENTFERPEFYIEKSKSIGYRWKSLLSAKLSFYSFSAIRAELEKDPHNLYIRKSKVLFGKQMILPIPRKHFEKELTEQLEIYRTRAYGDTYQYMDNLEFFREMLKEFPKSRFLVFTTPVSYHLIRLLVEQGLFPDYERWLRDLVDIFGEIWHFMYFNEITLDDRNFKDAHHSSHKVAEIIISKISDQGNDTYPHFGMKITKESLERDIAFLKENLFSGE